MGRWGVRLAAAGLMAVTAWCGVTVDALPRLAGWAVTLGSWGRNPAAAMAAVQQLAEESAASVESPAPESSPSPEPQPSAAPTPEASPLATPQPEATPAPGPAATPAASPAPAPEDAGSIRTTFYEQGSGDGYIPAGTGSIKNSTSLADSQVADIISRGMPFGIELHSDEPQVLIMHTHATETYELADNGWYDPDFTCRSTDNAVNMTAVGAEMARVLNAAGIHTVQDTTLHDYPSYNGSYERSNETVRGWLEKYPSIKVVLDVHRDAIEQEDGTRLKPTLQTEEGPAAQVMIICGADKGGNLPNYTQNLRFAAAWEAAMEAQTPGLTRPVMFAYRYYNQDLTTGSLLIEVGGHANTLDEAVRAGGLAARALASLLAQTA